jgi:hypothetical protein
MKIKCNSCDNIATWMYMPGNENYCYCDNCVPRGCSCNINPNTNEEDTDEQERLYPCCEFDNYQYGIDDDEFDKYED